jgi:hypothetical protein
METRDQYGAVAHPDVPGWGVDADPTTRPGVPAEVEPPRPSGTPSYAAPAQQATTPRPLIGQGRSLTKVYATDVTPRGVSGALRRVAYRIPDYKARRWLLLLAADRVDALEHGKRRLLLLSAVAGGALALAGARRLRAR